MDLARPGLDPGFDSLAGRSRGCGASPVVEARAGQAEDVAEPLHAVSALVIVNELVTVHQRVSVAKYRAALEEDLALLLQLTDPPAGGGSEWAPRRRPSAARIQFRIVSVFTPRPPATDMIGTPCLEAVQRDRVRLELCGAIFIPTGTRFSWTIKIQVSPVSKTQGQGPIALIPASTCHSATPRGKNL
ncbi:hypothetical protein [Streptomyces sp. Isolate_45]|uniref:hypothetical protein n=1 Tax=Streptomyces sp. Isolate_45 TaxID=2950111 RepID=UPI002481F528|nr:hypothetical protein [Streptomyces sp. Isolate_45]MDA5286018.1 hypothetical protein [Streptomyces sp. Isolate_45]